MEKTLYSKIFKNKKMIPRLKKSFTLQLKRLRAESIDIDFDVNEIIQRLNLSANYCAKIFYV